MKGSEDENDIGNMPFIMEEDESEDMELGDLDMDALEEECRNMGKGYVSWEHIELLQQAIIQSKVHKDLGISVKAQKGRKRKSPKEDQKRG